MTNTYSSLPLIFECETLRFSDRLFHEMVSAVLLSNDRSPYVHGSFNGSHITVLVLCNYWRADNQNPVGHGKNIAEGFTDAEAQPNIE